MIALALSVHAERLAVDRDGAGDDARDLVARGELVVIGRAVRRPGEVEIEVDGRTGLVLTLGVDVGGVGHRSARHMGGEAELLEGSAQVDLDAPAAAAVDG